MPLFESQASRNDRWFGGVQYAVHKIIAEEFGGEPEAATPLAWAEGGMHLAKFGVEHLATLKKAWGKGSLELTHALTTIFTLNMISRWYRAIRGDRPIKDETRAVQIAATNILTLLGQESLGDIVDFMNMHVQFIYECDWVQGKTSASGRRVDLPSGAVEIPSPESLHWGDVFQNPLAYDLSREQHDYLLELFKLQTKGFAMLGVMPTKERIGLITWGYHLIMDKALVVCGQGAAIDWRLQTFPVEKHADLWWLPERKFLPDTVIKDFPVWLQLLGDAQEKMFKTYDLLQERAST